MPEYDRNDTMVNNIPVRDLSTQGNSNQLNNQPSYAQAAVAGQNFAPQMPSSTIGMLMAAANPVMGAAKAVGSSFWDQTKYGMNDRAQEAYNNQEANYAIGGGKNPADMTPQERVQLARSGQMNEQLPHAFIGSPTTDAQRAAVANGTVNPTGGLVGGGNDAGAAIPNGSLDTGTFKPVTFRSGSGLYDKAEDMAMADPAQFNYNFDPEGAASSLFSERSALLDPVFAQQRARNMEQMQGLGRIGLKLSGEGLGAGTGSGMMNPDMYGMNAAQSNALANLSAQSTTDAFGQELQRAGLDMSQFMTNEGSKQNMFGNLTGLEALRQNYELSKSGQDIQREQMKYNTTNRDNGWLTGLTSLGTSFLGTNTGSNWLTGLFK